MRVNALTDISSHICEILNGPHKFRMREGADVPKASDQSTISVDMRRLRIMPAQKATATR
jgi:hypothetical protein